MRADKGPDPAVRASASIELSGRESGGRFPSNDRPIHGRLVARVELLNERARYGGLA